MRPVVGGCGVVAGGAPTFVVPIPVRIDERPRSFSLSTIPREARSCGNVPRTPLVRMISQYSK